MIVVADQRVGWWFRKRSEQLVQVTVKRELPRCPVFECAYHPFDAVD